LFGADSDGGAVDRGDAEYAEVEPRKTQCSRAATKVPFILTFTPKNREEWIPSPFPKGEGQGEGWESCRKIKKLQNSSTK